MGTDVRRLAELIAAWRKEYERACADLQDVSEPLMAWLNENRNDCPVWIVEDLSRLTLMATTEQICRTGVQEAYLDLDRRLDWRFDQFLSQEGS
jgi:hypothetical protein